MNGWQNLPKPKKFEARTLKMLHHWDSCITIFFVEAGKKYLAMELVHGQDLKNVLLT